MAIDIKKTDFEELVVRQSYTRPVLVDFWADWCNPCKALGPMLEKAETEYQGRFLVARVNTQTEQELAVKFKVSSIPYVILFENGAIKDQFVGAPGPEQLKQFLNKNIPHPEYKNVLLLLAEKKYTEAGDAILKHNINGTDAESVLWDVFKNLLKTGSDVRDLKKYIDPISDYGSKFSEIKSKFTEFYKNEPGMETLEKINHLLNDDHTIFSLEYFLEKIKNSTGEEKEKNKIGLFCCFHLLGESPLVNEYRRKLSSVLF